MIIEMHDIATKLKQNIDDSGRQQKNIRTCQNYKRTSGEAETFGENKTRQEVGNRDEHDSNNQPPNAQTHNGNRQSKHVSAEEL